MTPLMSRRALHGENPARLFREWNGLHLLIRREHRQRLRRGVGQDTSIHVFAKTGELVDVRLNLALHPVPPEDHVDAFPLRGVVSKETMGLSNQTPHCR